MARLVDSPELVLDTDIATALQSDLAARSQLFGTIAWYLCSLNHVNVMPPIIALVLQR
jgi:hypothetical protein